MSALFADSEQKEREVDTSTTEDVAGRLFLAVGRLSRSLRQAGDARAGARIDLGAGHTGRAGPDAAR